MISLWQRMRAAARAVLIHFVISVVVASMAASLVFLAWYPHPYGLLSGGRDLFLVLVSVDVVCGPLLTLVLFNPRKVRIELLADLGLVALTQMFALLYGLHTAYVARPLFLVHEIDRFRVITVGDFGDIDVHGALATLPRALRPHWLTGPIVVGIRAPKDESERREVMLEAIAGGRDYAQRPDFYIPYGTSASHVRVLARAKSLKGFIKRYPETYDAAVTLLKRQSIGLEDAYFLPVMHRQDWVAVLDGSARILGFLPGDGFTVSR